MVRNYRKISIKFISEIMGCDEKWLEETLKKEKETYNTVETLTNLLGAAFKDGVNEANYQHANNDPEWDG